MSNPLFMSVKDVINPQFLNDLHSDDILSNSVVVSHLNKVADAYEDILALKQSIELENNELQQSVENIDSTKEAVSLALIRLDRQALETKQAANAESTEMINAAESKASMIIEQAEKRRNEIISAAENSASSALELAKNEATGIIKTATDSTSKILMEAIEKSNNMINLSHESANDTIAKSQEMSTILVAMSESLIQSSFDIPSLQRSKLKAVIDAYSNNADSGNDNHEIVTEDNFTADEVADDNLVDAEFGESADDDFAEQRIDSVVNQFTGELQSDVQAIKDVIGQPSFAESSTKNNNKLSSTEKYKEDMQKLRQSVTDALDESLNKSN